MLMLMTSTKVEISFNKIARLADLSDLAELLFPGNRNQHHAFLAMYIELKWADHHVVPNLGEVARKHEITKRTMERVRAKMRRIGLIDHVSRFNASHGYREGWVMSGRFERSLRELADKMASLTDTSRGSREKDLMLLEFAAVYRNAAGRRNASGGETHVQVAVQGNGHGKVE